MEILTLKPQRATFTGKMSRAASADRTLTFTFTTEAVATDQGVVMADGMDAARFIESPTFFADHWTGVENKLGTVTAIRRNAVGWEGDFMFAPADVSQTADNVYRFLDWAGHGAVSIGFIPTAKRSGSEITTAELQKYGSDLRWIADKWQLLEISVVGVGADPGAHMQTATGIEGRMFRMAMMDAMMDHWKAEQKRDTAPPCSIDTTTTGPEGDPAPDSAAMHAEVMAAMNTHTEGLALLGRKLDALIEQAATTTKAATATVTTGFNWGALGKFPAPKKGT